MLPMDSNLKCPKTWMVALIPFDRAAGWANKGSNHNSFLGWLAMQAIGNEESPLEDRYR